MVPQASEQDRSLLLCRRCGLAVAEAQSNEGAMLCEDCWEADDMLGDFDVLPDLLPAPALTTPLGRVPDGRGGG